jgi:hypothetical protein
VVLQQAWQRLLYGLLNRGEAYLIPIWLMQEQRLAQVKLNQSINQSINQPTNQPTNNQSIHQASKQASKQASNQASTHQSINGRDRAEGMPV